jgi:hypothetical protein
MVVTVDVGCRLSIDNEAYPEPMASPRLAAVVGEFLGLGTYTYDTMSGRTGNGLPTSAASRRW